MMAQTQQFQQNMLQIRSQNQQALLGQQQSMQQMMLQQQQQAAQQQMAYNLQRQQLDFSRQMQLEQQAFQQAQLAQQQQLQRDLQYQQLATQQRQAEEQRALQLASYNAQIQNRYKESRQQVLNERMQIMAKHTADKLVYQKSLEKAQAQVRLNDSAANRAYVAEQTKLEEIKTKAAFERQTLLAKAIGNAGTILASGRTGQSIGLLINDVERQKGFAMAQQLASLDAATDAATISMEDVFRQARSANTQAFNEIGWDPQKPTMPSMPELPTFVDGIGLAIDTSQFK